jgi:hypothetical protein
MKKILFCAAILLSSLTYRTANAQLRINLGFNIGSQPDWGPVGYDHADYYYMPDIDAYYDVPAHQYVYYENNAWIHAGVLPARYHYDPYHSYKVVVNQRNPWEHHADIRTRYAGYRGRGGQQIIRDSHDQKYRNHWNGDRGPGRGPGDRGHDGGRGPGDHGHDGGRGGHGHDDHGHDDHDHGRP